MIWTHGNLIYVFTKLHKLQAFVKKKYINDHINILLSRIRGGASPRTFPTMES